MLNMFKPVIAVMVLSLASCFSKPEPVTLSMPGKTAAIVDPVKESRTMTILIGTNNVKYYMGKFSKDKIADITPGEELHAKIALLKDQVASLPDTSLQDQKNLHVLIKLDQKGNAKNLTKVLDEMASSDVETYAIVDIRAEEAALFTQP